jgi:hypothetical protein
MVGRTLVEIRERLESLADPSGRYYLVCARTGERPFPATGLRFRDRETAVEAADAASAYRAELRQWDQHLPFRDLVVCEDPYVAPDADLVNFCHEVAGAVFETLSARDRRDVEDAVMDAYLAAAERIEDRDRLCLLLLECVTEELAGLAPAEQVSVLRATADRLSEPASGLDPVVGTLDRFARLALLEEYDCHREATAWDVRIGGLELADGEGLPTLPFVVEYLRRADGDVPAIRAVESGGDHWRFRVIRDADGPDGLVRATVDG